MPRLCSVKSCTSLKENPNTSLFKAPVNTYDTWKEIITKVNGDDYRKVAYVCAKHFTENDLITSYVDVPSDVADLLGKRIRCGLKKGAIPSVFNTSVVSSDSNNVTTVFPKCSAALKPINLFKMPAENPLTYKQSSKENCTVPLIQKMLESLKKILLPIGWILHSDKETLLLYKPVNKNIKMIIEKQIVIQFDNLQIDYYVNQKCLSPDILGLKPLTFPLNKTEITNTVQMFERLKICAGGPCVIDFPGIIVKNTHLEDKIWHHNECSIVSASNKRCKKCSSLMHYFPICKKRLLLNMNTSSPSGKTPKKQKLIEETIISSNV